MNDDMVVIHTAHDITESDIIKGVLEDEGIPVFVQGYNYRSMLGMMGAYVDINIMVPERDAEKAGRLIAQAQMDIALPAEKEDIPEPTRAASPQKKHPKNWMVAVMLPLFMPGLGSYYVGRGDVGGWLLTFSGISIVTGFAFRSHKISLVAAALIPVLVVTDLIISIRTLRNAQRK